VRMLHGSTRRLKREFVTVGGDLKSVEIIGSQLLFSNALVSELSLKDLVSN
jgi:hypothetical protein